MTIFICSLFLPKTIQFDVGNRHRGGYQPRRGHATKPSDLSRSSPFRSVTAIEPASRNTPQDDPPRSEEPQTRHPQDLSGPSVGWGLRADQPKSTADCFPPSEIVGLYLDRQNDETSTPFAWKEKLYNDQHNVSFSSATWRVVDALQGNAGLRHAVDVAVRDSKSVELTWIGTLGMPTDGLRHRNNEMDEIEAVMINDHGMLVVLCPDKDFDGHYRHFCKQTLWPVLHYQLPGGPGNKTYEGRSWRHYVRVNQAFADKIIRNWKRDDTIWVHDYHLLLVPGMIRRKLPQAEIGFYLHVPFPSSEIFRCLAVREELLKGILAANLIGFQLPEYTYHFLQTCSRVLNIETTSRGLDYGERFVNVSAFAVGIDPEALNKHRNDATVSYWVKYLQDRYRREKILLAYDDLDSVCGVREKLLSYELFLKQNPEWWGKTVMIQVALAGDEAADQEISVSDIVARVNSSFGTLAYQPLVYLRTDVVYAQYLALLSVADIFIVTSKREGMNLSSHEYIVCQDGQSHAIKKHGSLILSEFTGTASLFGHDELVVNPWDRRMCADAIRKALVMKGEERLKRWENLHMAVLRNTGGRWFDAFVSFLHRVYEEQFLLNELSVPRFSVHTTAAQYRHSARRLFILSYDGLENLGSNNWAIMPNLQRIVDGLEVLLLDERNFVFISSVSRQQDLVQAFRLLPRLGFIAENGSFLKPCEGTEWVELADTSQIANWKAWTQPVLAYFLERTPGARIEERRCSFVFHYQDAEDYEAAKRHATELTSHFNDTRHIHRFQAVPMDNAVVVEPVDWTRSTGAQAALDSMRGGAKGRTGANETRKINHVVSVSVGRGSTAASTTFTRGLHAFFSSLHRLGSLH